MYGSERRDCQIHGLLVDFTASCGKSLRNAPIGASASSQLERLVGLALATNVVRLDTKPNDCLGRDIEELFRKCTLGLKRASLIMAHERRRAPRCPLIASAEMIELETNYTSEGADFGPERRRLLPGHDKHASSGLWGWASDLWTFIWDQHEILEKWLAAMVRA
jgi:hypothetical protein